MRAVYVNSKCGNSAMTQRSVGSFLAKHTYIHSSSSLSFSLVSLPTWGRWAADTLPLLLLSAIKHSLILHTKAEYNVPFVGSLSLSLSLSSEFIFLIITPRFPFALSILQTPLTRPTHYLDTLTSRLLFLFCSLKTGSRLFRTFSHGSSDFIPNFLELLKVRLTR